MDEKTERGHPHSGPHVHLSLDGWIRLNIRQLAMLRRRGFARMKGAGVG